MKTTTKRLLSILLAAVLALTVAMAANLPTQAATAEETLQAALAVQNAAIALQGDSAFTSADEGASVTAKCPLCGEQTWTALSAMTDETGGHIYVDKNVTAASGANVLNLTSATCLLLNNKTITGNGASTIKSTATLNILGTGTITGGSAENGGNIYSTGKLTIYGGTIDGGSVTKYGGNIYQYGKTLTIYGGIIQNGQSVSCGGNINGTGKCHIYIYGGTIRNGKVTGTPGGGNWGGNIRQWGGHMTITGGYIYGGECADATNGNSGKSFNIGIGGSKINDTTNVTLDIQGGTITGGILLLNSATYPGTLKISGNPQIVKSLTVKENGENKTYNAKTGLYFIKNSEVSNLSEDALIYLTAVSNGQTIATSDYADNFKAFADAACVRTSGTDLKYYTAHSYTATVVAPTCTEAGYTTHTCGCGKTYNDTEVDALGHNYTEPTFAWAEDYTCQATWGCENCDETWSDACVVTAEVTKAATCYAAGEKEYTASITVGEESYTNTVTEALKTIAHTPQMQSRRMLRKQPALPKAAVRKWFTAP